MKGQKSTSRAPERHFETEVSVLHCIPTLRGGGAERQLRLIAPELVRQGIKVAVLSRFTADELEDFSNAGIVCLPIRSNGNHNPMLALEYWRALRQFRPQVVQSWMVQMDLLCGMMHRNGARWILSERCSRLLYEKRGPLLAPLKHKLRMMLGNRSDMVVANSPSGLEMWESAPARMVIQNGVDLRTSESATTMHFSRLPPFQGRKIVLAVGRLAPQKQMEVLIAAVQRISEQVPACLLVILGEGPDRPRLERQIAAAGLQDHVRLEGFRTDVAEWFQAAEVFASASLFEGQPNAVLEAAAAGTPMLLSDIPEHRDAIGDGALYVSGGDADRFAEAIVEVMQSPTLAKRISAHARAVVEQSSVAVVAAAYAQLYRSLAAS